tara:strand:+ start:103 stop:543 length:441 start_codon:yes stop_codon:yes gene_type:complete
MTTTVTLKRKQSEKDSFSDDDELNAFLDTLPSDDNVIRRDAELRDWERGRLKDKQRNAPLGMNPLKTEQEAIQLVTTTTDHYILEVDSLQQKTQLKSKLQGLQNVTIIQRKGNILRDLYFQRFVPYISSNLAGNKNPTRRIRIIQS